MSLRDTEQIVQRALEAGLVGPEARRQLLHGLPMGFVYSLPTVSRPIDQLRFDLMELARTPRLIGLGKAPMAVWLENAVELALTRQHPEAARLFARQADQRVGGDANIRRVEAKLGGEPPTEAPTGGEPMRASGAPADAQTPAEPPPAATEPSHPTERVLVLTINPDAEDAWKRVEPRIEPEGRHFAVPSPAGKWAREHAPGSPTWRTFVDELDRTLEGVSESARQGGHLAVFADAPLALGVLIGARMNERLARRDGWTVFQHTRGARARWRPWGPSWSSPVEPTEAQRLVLLGPPNPDSESAALIVGLGRAHISNAAVNEPLGQARDPGMPRRRIEFEEAAPRSWKTAAEIEAAMRDLGAHLDALVRQHPRLRRLHLFPSAPLALAIAFVC